MINFYKMNSLFNMLVERVSNILSQMRPDARQKIVDKMEENLNRFYETGEKIQTLDEIIEEVILDMPDHKLFDVEYDIYPFVKLRGMEFCLN